MKQILLRKLIFGVFTLCLTVAGNVFSQEPTSNPIVKRNSPFSPNPKKKGDTATSNTVKKVAESTTEDVQAKSGSESVVETGVAKSEPDKSLVEAVPNPENTGFESRSVASKTLEIAKKASAVSQSPSEIYKIGVGDVLLISLQNAPAKETTYFTVLQDGTIDYPLAGEMVQIAGMTPEQVEDHLKEKIKLYENPLVSVKVREHNSHSFSVLGMVERSGVKTMQREAIPLYVVKAEAIVLSKATQVTLKREGQPTLTIDLKDTQAAETLVFPGDILEFGDRFAGTSVGQVSQFYFIGGEIVAGGRKDYVEGLTLTQAILESGGLKKTSVKKVIVRRRNESGMLVGTEYNLKLIKEGKAADPTLLPGDTIEIGN